MSDFIVFFSGSIIAYSIFYARWKENSFIAFVLSLFGSWVAAATWFILLILDSDKEVKYERRTRNRVKTRT